ncbi:MAG: PEP-CTERM sorting domain-containing protein, partial [Cyanobacteria bacterium J06560_2]
LVYGPDGNLYVSSGTTRETSAVYRFDGQTGGLIDKFASGGDLFRPYGLAFGPDGLLYVSSFRSDQILRYDGSTGAFVDVFAERDGTAAGLNGPNGLLFGPDGKLYATTQGSVADDEGNLDFAFPSQVLRYDIETGAGDVFAQQPAPFPTSFGFVSFLGLAVGPDDGDLYTSDFANGIRRYDFATGDILDVLDTNYTESDPSGNFVGSLAFGPDQDLYTVGFDTETTLGALLKFDVATGDRTTIAQALPELDRPIGLLFKAESEQASVPEPSAIAALIFLGVAGQQLKRR